MVTSYLVGQRWKYANRSNKLLSTVLLLPSGGTKLCTLGPLKGTFSSNEAPKKKSDTCPLPAPAASTTEKKIKVLHHSSVKHK